MKNTIRYGLTILLMLQCFLGLRAQEDNVLSLTDITCGLGNKVSLPVNLTNTCNDIVAAQFRLTLPADVIIDSDSVKFSVRTTSHTAVIRKGSNNSYVVMVYSTTNNYISGNSGQLMSIELRTGDNLTPNNDYEIMLSEVLLSNSDGNNVCTGSKGGTLHIADVPDFIVTTVQINPNEALAPGSDMNVTWEVKNQGGIASTGGWSEQISLLGTNGRTVFLGSIFHNEPLEPGASVNRQANLQIPELPGLDGQVQIQVKLLPNPDSGELTEHQTNNTTVSNQTVDLYKNLKLSVPSNADEGDKALNCRLARSGNWSSEQSFNLRVEGDVRISVPSIVTIPRGQSSVSFKLIINDDEIVNSNSSFIIIAEGNGYDPVTTELELEDNEIPSLSLIASKNDITEGETIQLTVIRNNSTALPLAVMLTCDESKHFDFPTTITIPAGESSVSVNILAFDDADFYNMLGAAFVASANQHDKAEIMLTLLDNDTQELQLILNPEAVNENTGMNAIIGKLRRSGNLDSEIKIQLTDDSDGLLTYSTKILTLKKGENEVKFGIGTTDDLLVNGERKVTLTASVYISSCDCYSTGLTSGSVSKTITVLDNDGPTLLVSPSASVFPEGSENNSLTISRNALFDKDITVNISSDLDELLYYEHAVVIKAGQTSVTVPVKVYENDEQGDDNAFTFTVTAQGFTNGTCWSMVSDQSLPDATITGFTVSATEAEAESELNMSITLKNDGNSLLSKGTPVTVYLDAAAIIQLNTEEVLSPGEQTTIETTYTLPAKTGRFNLTAVVNPNKRISELLYTNNSSATSPIIINPCLVATAHADRKIYQQGESITINGKATGTKGSNSKLEIYFINDNVRQTIKTNTDAAGNYTAVWTPLKGQAGHFILGACYPGEKKVETMDEFDVYGIITSGVRSTCQIGEGDIYTGSIYITNPGVLPQTGIHAEPQATSDNCEFNFTGIDYLEGGKTAAITFNIKGLNLTDGYYWQEMPLVIKSNEGSTASYKIYYYIMSQRGRLMATTSQIRTTMTLGTPREYPITIWNSGKGETGAISLALPEIMESVTPRTLPSLASGDSATIVLRFIPTKEMKANVPITGKLGINCSNGIGIPLFFELTPVSEAKGTLTVDVVDDFTYYTSEAPHVSDAKVKVMNRATKALVAEGVTEDDGLFSTQINEGVYTITVEAENHLKQTRDVMVDPGKDNKEDIFLSYDAITYDWDVVETTVEDEYSIETIVKFDTRVPQPVVVVSYPKDYPEPGSIFPVTVTNKGLINANDVEVNLRITGSGYSLEFLNNPSIDVLAPQQSVVFYAKIKQKNAYATTRNSDITPVLIECVEINGEAIFKYDCGPFANEREVEIKGKWGKCPPTSQNSSHSGAHDGYSGIGTPWGHTSSTFGSSYKYGPEVDPVTQCEYKKSKFILIEVDEKGREVSQKRMKGVAADGASRLKLVLDRTEIEKTFGKDYEITNVIWSLPEKNYGTLDNRNVIEPIFTAPVDFPIDVQAPSFTLQLYVYFEVNGFEQEATVDIEITRVPLILLHGFSSDESCWRSFANKLISDRLYKAYQIDISGYKNTNCSHLTINMGKPQKKIEMLIQIYKNNYIVATKADLVGHSMGGILSRLHVQYINSDNVHKVITVNTPHSGSEVGDFFDAFPFSLKYLLFYKLHVLGITSPDAISDLAVDSYAIDNFLNNQVALNKMSGIPVHAVVTEASKIQDLENVEVIDLNSLFEYGIGKVARMLNQSKDGWLLLLQLARGLGYNNDNEIGACDYVVSVQSQKGGLPESNISFIHGPWHSESPDDASVQSSVKSALISSVKSNMFSLGGFHPVDRKYAFKSRQMSQSFKSDTEDISTSIDMEAIINNDSLFIIAHGLKNVANKMILVSFNNDEFCLSDREDINCLIPSTHKGDLTAYAIWRDSNGNFLTDSLKINIDKTRANIIEIVSEKLYAYVNDTLNVRLTCSWSDGTITYVKPKSISSAKDLFVVYGTSIIPQKVGDDIVTFNYEGITCSTTLTIFGDTDENVYDEDSDDSPYICSTVKLSFEQKAVMTRQAFRGTLTVNNGHPTKDITDLKVKIEVRDDKGALATAHEFQIEPESLDGFAGEKQFDAGWTLSGRESGTATILFIPTKYAAPTDPKDWSFGGSFSYTDPYTGLTVTRDLNPVTLTVNPTPILDFTYFMQRDIMGDDPLTEEIESMEAAEFALIINNKGYGSTQNMKMTTDQPQIVDNAKGLAVNFEIISTQMNGQEKTLALGNSMTTDFGTIAPQSQAYAQWWLQSSLLGHFTEYDIKATHVTSHNNPDLSLLDMVTIHELIHGFTPIGITGSTPAGRAFLVNDIPDTKDQPDEVYFTNAMQEHVLTADVITTKKIADNTYLLYVKAKQNGWIYGSLADPTLGKAKLVSVERQSDGADIPTDNLWQTDRTLVDGKDPLYEFRMHFIGNQATTEESYILSFQTKPDVELKVNTIEGIPEDNTVITEALNNVTVVFNKPIDESSFTTQDLTLFCQGEHLDQDLIEITKESSTRFVLDLSQLNNANGLYTISVQTAHITDQDGFYGSTGMQAMWTQYLEKIEMRALVSPAEAGFVTPDYGLYDYGSNVILTATAAKGYSFNCWKIGDEIISTSNELDYQLFGTTKITAFFTPNHYAVDVDYNAVLGSVLNGGSGIYDYGYKLSLVALPANDCLFKYWMVDNEIVTGDTLEYTITQEHKINAVFVRNIYEQAFDLSKGWNWISSSLVNDSYRDSKTFLEPIEGVVERLVGINNELINDSIYGWTGQLITLDASNGYKLLLSQNVQYIWSGISSKPEQTPIILNRGWNWIGYLPKYGTSLSYALNGLHPSENDVIKNMDNFAVFTNGEWIGTLSWLKPGEGYMYYAAQPATFCYPSVQLPYDDTEDLSLNEIPSGDLPWHYNSHDYPDNTNLIGRLFIDDLQTTDNTYTIAAFCDGECRGIGKYVDDLLFLTIHGNIDDEQQIYFRAYENETGRLLDIQETITFGGQLEGTCQMPFALHIIKPTDVEPLYSLHLTVYPKPLRSRLYIYGETNNIKSIKVLTGYGSVCLSRQGYISEGIDVSLLSPGMYIVEITCNDGKVIYEKVIKANND